MTARIFIVGSCVSRDAFRFPNNFEVAEYAARTSLASAFEETQLPIDDALIDGNLSSEFQKRLVRWDTRKQLPDLLRGTDYDAILLDFVDERFRIIKKDGAFATLSNELAATKVHEGPSVEFEKPSDTERNARWQNGIEKLLASASARNVPVVLNRAYWASADMEGKEFDPQSVKAGNDLLHELYQSIADKVLTIDYEDRLVIGDPHHVWGRSPFHYIPEFYQHTLARLHSLLG